ncbi:MAG: yvdQ [Bacillales bacterium]|nr:yvdQ [Bacillales bacterium]
MGILDGNPKKEPMHYGEVHAVWSYLVGLNASLVLYQLLTNHVGDEDLLNLLKDKIHTVKAHSEELEELLKDNGVALPEKPAEKPICDRDNIPVGGRFTDPEVAACMDREIVAGVVACSGIMGMSIREDIALLFAGYHAKVAQYGLRLMRIKKDKGWLLVPPLHKG